MSERSAAVTCIKLLLTIFNLVFLVSGLAMLALGYIWMNGVKLQMHTYMRLTNVYYDAPYILIAVGCVIVLVGLLGCLCTFKGFPVLLYIFSMFLMLIFIVELSTAIAAFIYKAQLSDGLKSGLADAMNDYATEPNKKVAVDGLQTTLECCGSAGYQDWFDVDWSGEGPRHAVPQSCCNETTVSATECDGTSVDDIYTDGCFSKVSAIMGSNLLMIGGVAVGFSFLQLFGAVLACCLAKNINRAKYEQVA